MLEVPLTSIMTVLSTSATSISLDWDNALNVSQNGVVPEAFQEEDDDAATSGDSDVSSADDHTAQGSLLASSSTACFCLNCTSRLSDDDPVCEICGHSSDQNALIFNPSASHLHLSSETHQQGLIALLYDERMVLHYEGEASQPHPERPDRIRAVMARLLASGIAAHCQRIHCRQASQAELQAVHTLDLVQVVQQTAICNLDFSPDMYTNQHTSLCAKLAAGGASEVAQVVARGVAPHGAAIIRPPGHHAESGMAMGFCFFNNAAVAARAAQAAGAHRVIILDWDIHHGNGTQQIFEHDPSVLYMSIHRHDQGHFYPGTGAVGEVGSGRGEGFSVNLAWDSSHMGDGDYVTAFRHVLLPIANEFRPDQIIVSAGFDAAEGDPIGECCVSPAGFAHMTAMLKGIAPVVLLLEGGYNLHSTAISTEACLRVLLGEVPPKLPGPSYPSAAGWEAIQEAVQVHSCYWSCLQPRHPVSVSDGVGLAGGSCGQANDAKILLRSSLPIDGGQTAAEAARLSAGGSRIRKIHKVQQLRRSSKYRITSAIHKRAMQEFWERQAGRSR